MYFWVVLMLVCATDGRTLFSRENTVPDSWMTVSLSSETTVGMLVSSTKGAVGTVASVTTEMMTTVVTVAPVVSAAAEADDSRVEAMPDFYDFEDANGTGSIDFLDFEDYVDAVTVGVRDVVVHEGQTLNTTYRSEFAEGSATDKSVADEVSDKLVAVLERITLSLCLTLRTVCYSVSFIICGKRDMW